MDVWLIEAGMTEFDVDLFVIGAGSGGVRAARIAASYGAKVMVAEEFRIGGTCVIRGCVPKKLMVYSSRFKDEFEDAAGFGWTMPEPSFDWNKLVAAKEKEITRLSGIYRSNLEKSGVEIVESRAEVEAPHKVRLLSNGRIVTARFILVATGGSPSLEPEIPGIEHAITSNEIFDLPKLPERLIIVGGGYVSVEFACVFARFGTAVTLVMRGQNVLRGFDEDLRLYLRDSMMASGINFECGALPDAIEKRGGTLCVTLTNNTVLETDQIMLATGRAPHTRGLGLEKAGVAFDQIGAVKVDGFSKSNVDSIYAVGDVTNRIALTPVAIREGHAFADTIFGRKPVRVDHKNVATAVFTTPEVGTVGLTETEARAAYDCVDIYATSFRPLKATLSGRSEKTFMKIVVDGETDKVLGVHLFGEQAGEMAQLLGIVVKMGGTKADFDATMAVHPTSAEELVTMRTRTARHLRKAEADIVAAQ
jgi:glutathione reductase (NADPH)